MAAADDVREKFNELSSRFAQLLYGRTEGDRELMNDILDELNSIDYRYPVISVHTRAVLLVNQFCSIVPPDDSYLVAKCCSLITNLVNRQRVTVEGRTLTLAFGWILQALRQAGDIVTIDVLVTLDALLRSNVQNMHSLLPAGLEASGTLLQLAANDRPPEVILLAVQCLEACCGVAENYKSLDTEKCTKSYELCSEVFFGYLVNVKLDKLDDLLYCKLLITCLKGLQNIVVQSNDFLSKRLELLLGVTKSYMVYGLTGIEFLAPKKVMPAASSIPEPTTNILREKKGGKVTRLRKPHLSKTDSRKSHTKDETHDLKNGGYVPATTNLSFIEEPVATVAGCGMRTSDSDFSDSESGKLAKVALMEGRLRQASLGLLLQVCKLTDKRTMFSYWSSFIPDTPLSGSHSLTNCILRDPSPRGRMAALNVLLCLLSSSKLYLSQAEYSDRMTSFTPFSAVLGSIVKELHHCLSLALNETSYAVLTQALKCLASLVQATPYHRLPPGLTSKVMRNVKTFIFHKDSTVQVAALIVLGCVLASEPSVKETKDAFLHNMSPKKTEIRPKVAPSPDDFEYASFSSDDEQEPDRGDYDVDVPWLLHRCLRNLGVELTPGDRAIDNVPAPVKLESLQVMSAMSRNHFEDLILPYLHHVTRALELALLDKYVDVRMHGGHTIDFIGQAMNQHICSDKETRNSTSDQSLFFWRTLLNDSLVALLQCEQHPTLRTVGCDCLGSIGARAFEQLPRDKQLLCVTMLFSCGRDEDNAVRGSAVRALAISVMYPSLREDPGFVMDLAEAIHRTLNDENVGLRVKSSWSLANLSDVLVLNKADPNASETIDDSLLLVLIRDSTAGCDDNKIKSNTVRALGNLLQLIDDELIDNQAFYVESKRAITALVKCSTTGSNMKVRWNACYALGNILKNGSLYKINSWRESAFDALGDLVINFKNFKVRINAALALSSCPTRALYGAQFTPVWTNLVKALENSENMEDFSEYKHRDHLIEQICLSLAHLVTLLTPEDVPAWRDTFSDVALKRHMQKAYDHVIPEKSSALIAAGEHLAALKCSTSEQKEVIAGLRGVFHNDTPF